MPPDFQRGILLHRKIDSFTDSHAIFRGSVQRIDPEFRKFGGVLIDMFYDHFLARDWQSFSDVPLPQFASEFYGSFDRYCSIMPPDAYAVLLRMQAGDWLCSYHDIGGIEVALRRISLRLRRPFDLAPAIAILERDYDNLQADFRAFFPELLTYVSTNTPSTNRLIES